MPKTPAILLIALLSSSPSWAIGPNSPGEVNSARHLAQELRLCRTARTQLHFDYTHGPQQAREGWQLAARAYFPDHFAISSSINQFIASLGRDGRDLIRAYAHGIYSNQGELLHRLRMAFDTVQIGSGFQRMQCNQGILHLSEGEATCEEFTESRSGTLESYRSVRFPLSYHRRLEANETAVSIEDFQLQSCIDRSHVINPHPARPCYSLSYLRLFELLIHPEAEQLIPELLRVSEVQEALLGPTPPDQTTWVNQQESELCRVRFAEEAQRRRQHTPTPLDGHPPSGTQPPPRQTQADPTPSPSQETAEVVAPPAPPASPPRRSRPRPPMPSGRNWPCTLEGNRLPGQCEVTSQGSGSYHCEHRTPEAIRLFSCSPEFLPSGAANGSWQMRGHARGMRVIILNAH